MQISSGRQGGDMRITFTVESDDERRNFDTEDFNREKYLEESGPPGSVIRNLEKNLDNIRFTAETGGLKINRELAEMSLRGLADKTGISEEILQSYEDCPEKINEAGLMHLLKICNVMDCRLTEILTDKEIVNELKIYLDEED